MLGASAPPELGALPDCHRPPTRPEAPGLGSELRFTNTAAVTSIAVDQFPMEAGRVIQGILTDIGFMGSGIIWQAGNDIRGLTTAAGVWSVTAVGIMIWTGKHFLGLALFVVIIRILVLPKGPTRGYDARDNETVDPERNDKFE